MDGNRKYYERWIVCVLLGVVVGAIVTGSWGFPGFIVLGATAAYAVWFRP